MANKPIVSVVIPAYNAERFIHRSVESVLNQTYENVEILVSDDGSTDRTASIVKSYKDPRIVYLYQQNRGQGPARNAGIRQAKGEYIAFLDADDYYLPEKITREVEFLQQHPEYQIAYCNALHFYSHEPEKLLKPRSKYHSGDVFEDLLRLSINPNTLMFAREIFAKGFMFAEGIYGRYSEDWELCLRVSRAGYQFGYLDEDLVVVEIRNDSVTHWDKQWVFKKNALTALQNLFSQMESQERKRFKADEILRRSKAKLAVAYLINMQKRDFFATIRDIYSVPISCVIGAALLVPARFLSAFLITMWKLKQRRSFCSVSASGTVRWDCGALERHFL